jgi:hypothetical protein
MKKIALLIVVLWLANAAVPGQYRKFHFEDEICAYKGTYNTRLYTEKQLAGAYRLWFTREFEMDIYKARVTYVSDIEKLPTTAQIDYEYALKSAALKKLEVVNLPFWKNLKAQKLKILEQDYKLARASVQAYRKPAALSEVTFAEACVRRYAPPLTAGGNTLLAFWRALVEERLKDRADADAERKNIERILAAEDRFQYAQLVIISYEWWNCAYPLIDRGEADRVASKKFWKLFKRVETEGCDYA